MFLVGVNWCRPWDVRPAWPVYSCWESGLHQQLSLEKSQGSSRLNHGHFPEFDPFSEGVASFVCSWNIALLAVPAVASNVSWSEHSWRVLNMLASASARWIKRTEEKSILGSCVLDYLFGRRGRYEKKSLLFLKWKKLQNFLVGFGSEGEESSQNAECSWFRISCWIHFRKLFKS